MLQLACILNMVSVWRRAVLRVFLCTDSNDPNENQRRKTRLDDLLNQLRIHALTCLVPLDNVKSLLNRPSISNSELIRLTLNNSTDADLLNVSDTYLKSVNQLVKQHSEQSALCFLYLPAPPVINETNNVDITATNNSTLLDETASINISETTANDINQRYIRTLEIISDSLPTSLFVNGVSCVTSTNL